MAVIQTSCFHCAKQNSKNSLTGLQSHSELQGDFCYEASVNPQFGTILAKGLMRDVFLSHYSHT